MKASDNPYPSLLIAETAAPPAPPAGEQRLFIDPADHVLKSIDSAGTVTAQQGVSTINQLSDVDTATTPPTSGQVLEWNGTNWVPATVTSGGGSVNSVTAGDATITVAGTATDPTVALGTVSIDKLSDVDTTTTAPVSGQVLKWDGTNWTPQNDATSSGGGGVSSVTAGNSTITIGGTATDPTVAANVGTATGTVAAGDDSRIVNAVPNTRTVAGHALSADVTLSDADIAPVAPNEQTGATYTFVLADGTRLVNGNSASAQTFTIPTNASVAFPLGTILQVYQRGAGQVTLAGASGVTLRTPRGAKTALQYTFIQATQVAADNWAVSGDATT